MNAKITFTRADIKALWYIFVKNPSVLTNKDKIRELCLSQLTITCSKAAMQVNVSWVDTSWSSNFLVELFQFLLNKKCSKNIWKMKDARTRGTHARL